MIKKFLCAAALMALFAIPTQAGVMGSALLSLSDIKVRIVTGPGTSRDATGSFTGTPADFSISTSTTTATNESNLTGFTDGDESGSTFVAGFAGIITDGNGPAPGDALAAYSGTPGYTPTTVFETGAIGPNYSRSDSVYGGSFVTLTDTTAPFDSIPSPAAAATFADFNVDTPNLNGDALGNVTNTSQFSFTSTGTLTAFLEFDALVELFLDNTGSPPNYYSEATSSFSITLSGTSPNPGFGLGDAEEDLNQTITLGGGPASDSYTNGLQSYESSEFTLVENGFYTLSINQTSSILLRQVPEPGSAAIFGCILGCVGFVRRRQAK